MKGSACPLRRDWYKDRRLPFLRGHTFRLLMLLLLLLLGDRNQVIIFFSQTNIIIYNLVAIYSLTCCYLFLTNTF